MAIINLKQGSPEWHAHRAKHFNASDAAAMLGISKYKTRYELLREKATGIILEVDAATQARFDRGHAIEASARPLAERILDDELFPIVLADTINGIPLSASLDGLTMAEDIAWECKTTNAALEDAISNNTIPDDYKPQMEQGLLLSGAERCLFTASDGTEEGTVWAWYVSDPDVRAKLLAGWKQFAEDLANYQHVEPEVKPVPATIEALPALIIQVEGRVLATNLDAFRQSARTFLDGIQTELVTDQDFADADKTAKFLKDGEDRLELVKAQTLAQTSSIDELFRTIDAIKDEMRSKRLSLEKRVKSEKEARKEQLANEYRELLLDHLRKLDERIGGKWMPRADTFQPMREVVHGLKTLESMRDKLGVWLANAKILANEIADRIEVNGKTLTHLDWPLFPDFTQVCTKDPGDFANLLAARASERTKREEAIKEAERLRLEEVQRGKASTEDVKPVPNTRTEDVPGAVIREDEGTQVANASTPPITINLKEINKRLAPISLHSEGLESLGFLPYGKDRASKLYRESDFPRICAAIVRHLQTVSHGVDA